MIDGTVILTVEDLLQWTNDFYKKRFLQSTKTTLLDKVELNTPLPPKSNARSMRLVHELRVIDEQIRILNVDRVWTINRRKQRFPAN